MHIGVVSDTHNNLKNIELIIRLFNEAKVDLVIHTGDIANSKSLDKFRDLNCELVGVFGNNDRGEKGLKEVAISNNFQFQEPPKVLSVCQKNIAIFHEPDSINEFLLKNKIDVVVHGHTHTYRNEMQDGVLFFNPGESAGMMKGKNAVGILNLESLNATRIFF
tara:strand:+ start:31 stop:519 length:489 start_codon:yes stop_codon:yes gene_type:complete